jgi:8-oxo-dGTP pyrophosphatase MutT (NUDIX family)
MAATSTSCGVIVTDGKRLLLGHATGSPRWDIPKGVAEPGESFVAAAVRELHEETGLRAPETELRPLGVHAYRRGKDLALFCWASPDMPDPTKLVCTSYFPLGGRMVPEFDRFGLFSRDEAVTRVGKDMARLLGGIALETAPGAASRR